MKPQMAAACFGWLVTPYKTGSQPDKPAIKANADAFDSLIYFVSFVSQVVSRALLLVAQPLEKNVTKPVTTPIIKVVIICVISPNARIFGWIGAGFCTTMAEPCTRKPE